MTPHLTPVHAQFWLWHRGPRWLPRLAKVPSVHTVINEHDRSRYPFNKAAPRPNLDASNLIGLLTLARRNMERAKKGESIVDYLRELAAPDSWDARNNRKRYAYAVRWVRTLDRKRTSRDMTGVC